MSDHFAMVWSDLLGSSINEEDVHVRWCFLVMLLLADKEGNFRSTTGFLSRMAVVPIEQAEEAFRVLSSPDAASTSKDEEGRRVVSRGPNEWRIVNYPKYRSRYLEERKREQAKERKRAQRDRDGQGVTERDGHGHGVTKGDPVDVDVDVVVDVDVPVCDGEMGESEGEKKPKKKRSVFKPPTLDEASKYIEEKNLRVMPGDFIDFYQSKGWMVGKGMMKDWKASCRRAEKWDSNIKAFAAIASRAGADHEITPEMKERNQRLKHILKHATVLATIDTGDDQQQVILRDAAVKLGALVESDISKSDMEGKFYTIHDEMMRELLNSLPLEEEVELRADFPGGGVVWETWVKVELEKRFKIPSPLDYEFDPADVP